MNLNKKGVKINKNEVVFITQDGDGQTIWLESGTSSAGLKHIIQRHSDDFLDKHGIEKSNIPNHLKDISQMVRLNTPERLIKTVVRDLKNYIVTEGNTTC